MCLYLRGGGSKQCARGEGNATPSWDYKCTRCGRVTTEVFRNADDRDRWEKRSQPVCGAYVQGDQNKVSGFCTGTLERQWPAPNFKLVGAGFHDNDYPKGK